MSVLILNFSFSSEAHLLYVGLPLCALLDFKLLSYLFGGIYTYLHIPAAQKENS